MSLSEENFIAVSTEFFKEQFNNVFVKEAASRIVVGLGGIGNIYHTAEFFSEKVFKYIRNDSYPAYNLPIVIDSEGKMKSLFSVNLYTRTLPLLHNLMGLNYDDDIPLNDNSVALSVYKYLYEARYNDKILDMNNIPEFKYSDLYKLYSYLTEGEVNEVSMRLLDIEMYKIITSSMNFTSLPCNLMYIGSDDLSIYIPYPPNSKIVRVFCTVFRKDNVSVDGNLHND
jgi:hypothetical protein